jgi:hypothetical protein
VNDETPRQENGSHDSAGSSVPGQASSQLVQPDLTSEELSDAAEIAIIISRRIQLTYRYSGRARSRTLLIFASALVCLVLIAVPGVLELVIKPDSLIVRSILFIPIALSIPYIFYLVYRLSIQASNASAGTSDSEKPKLRISFVPESKELAGWAGALAGIVTVVSTIIVFIH